MQPIGHILVPTDFGASSERAALLARSLAEKFDAKLTLLHVFHIPAYAYSAGLAWRNEELVTTAECDLEFAVNRLRAPKLQIDSVFVWGDPREQILEIAKERNVDLIVMGTHGRRGLSRVFLGSVTERIVRVSPVPVLTVSEAAQESIAARSSKPPPRSKMPSGEAIS